MSDRANNRLATYGTLAPGRVNHHQLSDMNGIWSKGTVRGRLVEAGWGAEEGYPGMVPDPSGQEIEVHIFESPDLARNWQRLDAFEGPGYRRVVVQAETEDGSIPVSIYQVEL